MSGLNQQEIIRMMEEFDDQVWAKNSRFYKSVMQDGNIFNPYIHRRWLPAQFHSILRSLTMCDRSVSEERVKGYFSSVWGITSIIKNTAKEINLLAFLEYRDRIAFRERSLIYSLEVCKTILVNYGQAICDKISRLNPDLFIVRKQRRLYSVSEILNYCMAMIVNIGDQNTYKELDEYLNNHALHGLKFEEIYKYTLAGTVMYDLRYTSKFDKALETFMLAGAYYSLKSYYMFDKLGRSTVKSQIIRNELEDGKDWKYFLREYCTVKGFDTNL